MPGPVNMVDTHGNVIAVAEKDVAGAYALGYRPESFSEQGGRVAEDVRAEEFGGTGARIASGITGALRGATLGLSDAALGAIGGEEARSSLQSLREENPYTSGASEFIGAIAPAIVTGGAALPAGLVARAGRGAATAVGGGLRGALVGGAAEGALFGAGEGVTELALSQDPLTIERAASTLSSHALFGAAAGGVAGGVAHGAEVGLSRAKGAVDDWLTKRAGERAAAEAAARPVPIADITAATDLATLDTKGLRAAEEHELGQLEAQRRPTRERFVADLEAAHRAREESKDWLAALGARHDDKLVRENAKVVFNVDRRIRNLLDNREGLLERPGRAKEWLQQERQALETLQERGRQDLDRYVSEATDAPRTVRAQLLANEIDGYRVGKGGISPTSPVIDDIVAREVEARFPRAANGGLVVPKELAGIEDNSVGMMLNRNRQLQQTLANLERAPGSDRLRSIEDAREALRGRAPAPKEPESPIGTLLQAAAPFAGPLGAVASSGARALGGLRKAAGVAGERAAKAGSAFLDVAGKAAGKAAPYAPVAATKALGALSYADKDEPAPPRLRQVEEPSSKLAAVYRKRADEIKMQTEVAEDGSYQMRADARAKLAAKFDGIRHTDPHAADQLETIGARRIAYLASIIPRRPDIGGIPAGPDRWQPSDMAMRSFARSASAVEDPHAVLDRAAGGSVVPEEAAALRAVYPELLADFTNSVVAQLPSLRKTLPYKRRLALSMLTGTPVDAAMTPAVLREIQSMYAAEPGTDGGTQAPRAQPQFGSVKRSDPGTPAQRREGLTS